MNKQDEQELCDKIYIKILNFLSYKNRSVDEIRRRLDRYGYLIKKKGVVTEAEMTLVLGKVLETLETDGYLEDKKFVDDAVVNFNFSTKPKSARRLRIDLMKKGIKTDLIDTAVGTITPEQELASAVKEAEKKLRLLRGKDPKQTKVKVQKYLLGKGYTWDTIKRVFDTLD